MYGNFAARAKMPGVKNNSIAGLLNSGLQQFLPTPLLAIFNDVEFVATIGSLLGPGSPAALSLTTLLNGYASDKAHSTVGSNLGNPSVYVGQNITLDDPTGTTLQQQAQQDLLTNYIQGLGDTVVAGAPTLTADQIKTLMTLLAADAAANFKSAFNGEVGVPPMPDVVKAVINESSNLVHDAVIEALDTFAKNLIIKLGVVLPVNVVTSPGVVTPVGVNNGNVIVNPIDHLINVKRSIEARLAMEQTGVSSAEYLAVQSYLSQVLVTNDLSTANLTALNTYMDTVLNTNPVIS
jgi:hypothetical protein